MCFSLGWFEQLLIWAIVIAAAFAIVKLVLPKVLAPLGEPATTIVAILNIVLWAAVAIVIVVVAFELLACLLGGGLIPRLPR